MYSFLCHWRSQLLRDGAFCGRDNRRSTIFGRVVSRNLQGVLHGVLLVVIAVVCRPALASAQDSNPASQQTTAPPSARFEIVQSPLSARWTFRLDRYSGEVSMIVSVDDNVGWEKMMVLGLPSIQSPSKPRFQIFTSGIAARHTFLLDTETGKSWMVVMTKMKNPDGSESEVNLWQPFAE